MDQNKKSQLYDLEDRTFEYAKSVRAFIKSIPKTLSNIEDGKQLIRSSGSVGANYIEANEALSKKDFLYRIKLCRKEAKESRFWIKLMDTEHDDTLNKLKKSLANETTELMKIFGSIVTKSQ